MAFLFLVLFALLSTTSSFLSPSVTKRSVVSIHFDEAVTGNPQLSASSLPADRYLATNRFNVREGSMAKFEKRWADRKSRLALLPGFRFFTLLKRVPAFGITYDSEEGNYVSFTYWETKDNFDSWRKGDAFKEAHGGGGIVDFIRLVTTALFIVKGSPKPAFYDALLFKGGERVAFDAVNGWRQVNADGVNLLPTDIFMAQNRFKITPGKEVEFEQHWANRESKLQDVPGFLGFSLLRRDADKADDGFNYISCSIWKDMKAFQAWRESESFATAHSSTFSGNRPNFYAEPPKLAFYEGKLSLANSNGI
mmetsp:Transcript_21155/g.22939  ORF Transcript_21155/g.22939 Transcript_21155/m.22939 type:complete len:308 (-) Transcript_21155:92-1015(-)